MLRLAVLQFSSDVINVITGMKHDCLACHLANVFQPCCVSEKVVSSPYSDVYRGFISTDTTQSMMCAIRRTHHDLKVVFCLGMLLPTIIILIRNLSQALHTYRDLDCLLCLLWNIWGCMCSTDSFKFWWPRGYIRSSSYDHHHHLESGNLCHSCHIFLYFVFDVVVPSYCLSCFI